MNKMISVFNEKGNFGGNIEVKESLSYETLVTMVAPHRLDKTAQPNSGTFSVRPMIGLQINEDGFYSLLLSQLTNAGVTVSDSVLHTGFGGFELNAKVEKVSGGYTAAMTITDVNTGAQSINIQISRGTMDEVNGDILTLVQTTQAVQALFSQGAEFLIEKLQSLNPCATETTEKPSAEEAPARPQAPVQIVAPTTPVRTAAPVKEIVRNVIDNAVKSNRPQAPGSTEVLGYLEVQPADRPQPLWVLVQMTSDEVEQFRAEGILTTILERLENSSVADNKIFFENSKGYLMKIRAALADHGITPVSITPREAHSVGDTGLELVALI